MKKVLITLNKEMTLKRKMILIGMVYFVSHNVFALETFRTGVKLSNNYGDMYCQNIVHNEKSDWRMPSMADMLQLLSEGEDFETTYCSNTIEPSIINYYKCINSDGTISQRSPTQSFELMCVRGKSDFSQTPSIESCPTAAYSMSEGILHIPLVNVPDMLGNIVKYDVHLKMISDDATFQLLRATPLN
mgnify:CR=1 FL=1